MLENLQACFKTFLDIIGTFIKERLKWKQKVSSRISAHNNYVWKKLIQLEGFEEVFLLENIQSILMNLITKFTGGGGRL